MSDEKRIVLSVCAVSFRLLFDLAFQRRRTSGFFSSAPPKPAAVALPAGYRIDVVASGLTFPTGLTFDEAGNAYVVKSGYSYGEVFTVPRQLKGGRIFCVARDGRVSRHGSESKDGSVRTRAANRGYQNKWAATRSKRSCALPMRARAVSPTTVADKALRSSGSWRGPAPIRNKSRWY